MYTYIGTVLVMTETDHMYTSTCIVTATVMTVPDTDVHIHSNGNSDEGLLSLYIARYYVIALYRALFIFRDVTCIATVIAITNYCSHSDD